MKQLWFVLVVAGALSVAGAATEYEGARFKRANILVRDLDRSLVIYNEILGMSVDSRARTIDDSYVYRLFGIPKTADLHFALLSAGADQARTIGLIEVSGIEMPARAAPYTSSIVLRVSGLTTIIEKLRLLGVSIVRPNVSSSGDGGKFVEQAFVDYDGNVVLLYEPGGELPPAPKADQE